MKERPDLFSRSKFTQNPYQVDPHDALYVWKPLTCFSNKWIKQRTVDSKPPKPGPVQVPDSGAVYSAVPTEGNDHAPSSGTAGTAMGTATKAELDVQAELWFGPVCTRRNLMSFRNWEDLKTSISHHASDRLTRNIAVNVARTHRDQGGSDGPPAMTPFDRRVLAHQLVHSARTHFIRDCALYEPEDISAAAKEATTGALAPALSVADAI